MGLVSDCQLLFGTSDFYQLLNINKEASELAIKQAYRKLSLKVHPDRVSASEKKNATKKFQVLSKVSRILLNKDLRSTYDEEGEVDDDSGVDGKNVKDWSQYWRTMFRMTIDDMKKYEETYRHSQLEADDLKAVYVECEGDMDRIFEMQLCSQIEDEDRYRKILEDAINEGTIPSYDNFTKETKAKKRKRQQFYAKEKNEAEAERKRQNMGDIESEEDLQKLIMSRHENRQKEMNSFLDGLEAKYVKPKKTKSSRGRKKKS